LRNLIRKSGDSSSSHFLNDIHFIQLFFSKHRNSLSFSAVP
jgi:hypothetical protein